MSTTFLTKKIIFIAILVHFSTVIAKEVDQQPMDDLHGCRYNFLKGYKLREQWLTGFSMMSYGAPECIKRHCLCSSRCIGSFDASLSTCMITQLGALPLSWSQDIYFEKQNGSGADDVVAFYPSSSLSFLPRPEGFWPMDNVLQFTNIGKTYKQLTINHTMQYKHDFDKRATLFWPIKHEIRGPLELISKLRYGNFADEVDIDVYNFINGHYILDFCKPFTVMMWIKGGIPKNKLEKWEMQPLFTGWNYDENTEAFHIWVMSGLKEISILARGTMMVFTEWAKSDLETWNHIAVVSDSHYYLQSYLNAKAWKHREAYTRPVKDIIPTVMRIGYAGKEVDADRRFTGSIACLSVIMRELNPYSIRTYKQACP